MPDTNLSPTPDVDAEYSSPRAAGKTIQLRSVIDESPTNRVMMNFWSKKVLTNKFARCFVIPNTLPITVTATMSCRAVTFRAPGSVPQLPTGDYNEERDFDDCRGGFGCFVYGAICVGGRAAPARSPSCDRIPRQQRLCGAILRRRVSL